MCLTNPDKVMLPGELYYGLAGLYDVTQYVRNRVLNFVLSIAPQSGFKLQAPRLHLFHKTTHRTVDLQRN